MPLPQNNLVDDINQNMQNMQNTAVTPQGMAGTGATPQQVSMAGTPNQTQSVLQKKREDEQKRQKEREQRRTLQEQQVQEEPAEQKVRAEKLGNVIEKFQGGGHLMSMVAGKISQQMADVDKSQLQAKQFEGDQDPLNAIAAKLMRGETLSYQDVEILNQNKMTAENLFEGGDKINFGGISSANTTIENLGPEAFTDVGVSQQELAGLLGVAPEELAGMTIDQLQVKLQDVQNQELNRAEQLQAQALSLPEGSAERAQIEQELLDIQGTGEAAIAEGLQQTTNEFEAADRLIIDGEERQLDELFQDKELADQIPYLLSLRPEDVQDNPVLQELVRHANTYRDEYEKRLGEAQRGVDTVATAKIVTEEQRDALGEEAWKALGGKEFGSKEELDAWKKQHAGEIANIMSLSPEDRNDKELIEAAKSGGTAAVETIKEDRRKEAAITEDLNAIYHADEPTVAQKRDPDMLRNLLNRKFPSVTRGGQDLAGFVKGSRNFIQMIEKSDPETQKKYKEMMAFLDPDGNNKFDFSDEMREGLKNGTLTPPVGFDDFVEELRTRMGNYVQEQNQQKEQPIQRATQAKPEKVDPEQELKNEYDKYYEEETYNKGNIFALPYEEWKKQRQNNNSKAIQDISKTMFGGISAE